MRKAFWILAVIALCGHLSAAPYLEIRNYSTTPSVLYPGTQGYLSVSISNTGDTATDTGAVTYSALGSSDTVQMGALAAGSNFYVSVPVFISEKAANGIQLADLEIYYAYKDDQSNLRTGENRISIPLTVKQYDPLIVGDISFGSTVISVGGKVPVRLELRNMGGVINNAEISVAANSSFYLDGISEQEVGSIAANSSKSVSLTLVSSSDTPTGTYGIPLVISYRDQLNELTEETVSIGPVSVVGPSMGCRLTLVPEGTVEVGSEVVFNLSIYNAGADEISAVADLNSTGVFTPLGTQTVYFDSVPGRSTASREVRIGVSSSASAGYYVIPVALGIVPGGSVVYNVGVPVEATPEVKVIMTEEGGAGQIQITNTGNTQIRSVNMVVTQDGSLESTESFIGTLNVDDYSTMSLSGNPSQVRVTLAFRDSNNQLHTVEKTLSAGSTVADSSTGSQNGAFRSGNMSRSMGLFGPGTSGGSSQTDYALLGGIVVVVVVAGYLFYRRFLAKPKQAR